MELQKTKHQLKLEEWKSCVQACRSSGMKIKDWCAEQGINKRHTTGGKSWYGKREHSQSL